ncbi:hypothetical protein ARMGADRAFT_1087867 [Armillaria gallica]|uniref:DUF6534 domain-containing protein n=1 Tax=Armillaria gallica TaxID=47427 RepID=A0A2H3D0J9_ARMGA|nr:hypothetical protein ARMGADRAFT_1087867 [Armillaria gallica]
MDSAAAIVPSLGKTIGAAYVGAMLSSLLFGITVLQVFIYYRDYPNDWQLYRYSVGILWVLDAFHLSLTIHVIYHYTVDSFGDYVALGNVVWSVRISVLTAGAIPYIFFTPRSLKLQILVNVVIIVFVQRYCVSIPAMTLTTHSVPHSLYAVRLWKLGRYFHRFLPCIVIFVVTGGFAVGVMIVYKTFVPRLSLYPSEAHAVAGRYCITTFTGLALIDWAVDISFATATGIDFFISFAICYYLHKSRSISEFSSTNSRLLVLMWFVLMSGLATSACSTVALITFIVLPNTLVFLGVESLLTKLYVNSLLSMLNARNRLQGAKAGSGAALSEPTSLSNIIRLTPTGGSASAGFAKRDGFNIPLSEIGSSGPSPDSDSSQIVENTRSRVGFSVA